MITYCSKIILILILILNSATYAVDNIIPDDRLIEWTPGIPGGIPFYPAGVNVTDYGAVPDDGNDDREFVLNAINNCPEGRAVYFPAGTYHISDDIEVDKSIVLRGAGPAETKILYTGGSGDIIKITKRGYSLSYIGINSGYEKGSTSINLSSTEGLSVDDIIYITQEDDGDLVNIRGKSSGCTWCGPNEGNHCLGQVVRITGIDGNNISIDKPLYFTFSQNLNPAVREFTKMLWQAGIEDICIKRMQHTDGATVLFDNAYRCWARNIESDMCGRSHILLTFSAECEIRDSYIHEGYDLGSSWGYGIYIMWSNSDHLIENNIVNHVRHSIVFEGGGSGCVMGYNYSKDPENSDYGTPCQDISYHGAHPFMNLWEGNIGFMVSPDNTWGSSSHSTWFRNHVTNKVDIPVDTGWLMWVMDIEKNSVYHNFIGNVLGYDGMEGYIYETDDCDVNKAIWHWGCRDQSGSNTDRSDEPRNTSLRHGNFDYVTNSVKWDPSIADTVLPSSYYLPGKPEFFGGLEWPPFGPDVPGYTQTIPAKARFEGGAVNIEDDIRSQPNNFTLSQNYPNPFNPTTTIEYSLPADSKQYVVGSKQMTEVSNQNSDKRFQNKASSIEHQISSIQHQSPNQQISQSMDNLVSLKIYDILGREVTALVNKPQSPGNYKVTWDGKGMPSGVYFYSLRAGKFYSAKKMILVK